MIDGQVWAVNQLLADLTNSLGPIIRMYGSTIAFAVLFTGWCLYCSRKALDRSGDRIRRMRLLLDQEATDAVNNFLKDRTSIAVIRRRIGDEAGVRTDTKEIIASLSRISDHIQRGTKDRLLARAGADLTPSLAMRLAAIPEVRAKADRIVSVGFALSVALITVALWISARQDLIPAISSKFLITLIGLVFALILRSKADAMAAEATDILSTLADNIDNHFPPVGGSVAIVEALERIRDETALSRETNEKLAAAAQEFSTAINTLKKAIDDDLAGKIATLGAAVEASAKALGEAAATFKEAVSSAGEEFKERVADKRHPDSAALLFQRTVNDASSSIAHSITAAGKSFNSNTVNAAEVFSTTVNESGATFNTEVNAASEQIKNDWNIYLGIKTGEALGPVIRNDVSKLFRSMTMAVEALLKTVKALDTQNAQIGSLQTAQSKLEEETRRLLDLVNDLREAVDKPPSPPKQDVTT